MTMETYQGKTDAQGRKWVSSEEVYMLVRGAEWGTKYRDRNALLVLMLYRHALQDSELCNLKLDSLDIDQALMTFRREGEDRDTIHPFTRHEKMFIQDYLKYRKRTDTLDYPWLFLSEQKGQLSSAAINNIIKSCSKFREVRPMNSQMLRDGCGHYLVSKGYDEKFIQIYMEGSTKGRKVRYTKKLINQFKEIWE